MRLKILAIGKMKKGPESDLLERYVQRSVKAGRQLGLDGPHVREWSESRLAGTDDRKGEEAAQMLAGVKPGAVLVALDEHGRDMNSPDLAAFVQDHLDSAVPEMIFALGGPDGHGRALLDAASLTLRLGSLTWPHQLARVMLAEQLYRSITILSGHPYHRV